MLAGCGFHLRGSTGTAEHWGAVQVVSVRNVPLEAALILALRDAGGVIVDERAAADLVVELIEQKESRRTLSYTDLARTAEYEVTAWLRYRVTDRGGEERLAERRVTSVRTFRVERSNLAASSQEEAMLRDEQSADLVQQVVRSLDAAARAGDDADPA
jgi:LPS-assembly lipoprotein